MFAVGPVEDSSKNIKAEAPDNVQIEQAKTEVVSNDVIEYSGQKYYKLEKKYSLDNGNMTNEELADAYLSKVEFECNIDKKSSINTMQANNSSIENNPEEVLNASNENSEITTQTITLKVKYPNEESRDFLESVKLIDGDNVIESTEFDDTIIFEIADRETLDNLSIEYGSYKMEYFITKSISELCN